MHTTATGGKIKTLQKDALELARKAKAAKRATEYLTRSIRVSADKARAEALSLKPLARLEDLPCGKWRRPRHKERTQKIHLLNGHMERRWQNSKCPYRELREDG